MIVHPAILFFLLLLPSAVYAADSYPTTGLLHATKENSSLSYNCRLRDNTLNCNFIQMFARRKISAENAITRKRKEIGQYEKAKKEMSDERSCDGIQTLFEVITNKSTPEAKSMPEAQYQASKKSIELMGQFCKSPTKANWAAIVENSINQDLHTCKVGSLPFSQTFKRTKDAKNNTVWVVNSKASGPCAVVRLDRFQIAPDSGDMTFWQYISKKAITNPNGDAGLFKCSELDEAEYLYDWKSRELFLGCNIIQFSP